MNNVVKLLFFKTMSGFITAAKLYMEHEEGEPSIP